MKKIVYYIALVACLASCIYPYTPELESNPDKTLVVEGKILLGGISTIRLTYLMPLDNSVTGVPMGTAWVEDAQGNRFGSTSAALGNNIRIDTGNAPLGREYRAVVEVDGETYVSDWLQPSVAPVITNISFGANDYNVTVYVDLDTVLDGSGYIGFLFDETWEFHSDFYPEYTINPQNWAYQNVMESQYEYPYYWCYRTMSTQQIVLLDYTKLEEGSVKRFPLHTFSRDDSRNHKRYSILVKAFALSKEAFLYNKQMQEMSEIGGDLFSPDPGALQSNLLCESNPEKDVLGLVMAGDVSTRRAFMYNTYYIQKTPYYDFVNVGREDMPRYYYDLNFRPVKEVYSEEEGTFIGWAPHYCINCIEKGGFQEKPDFWED